MVVSHVLSTISTKRTQGQCSGHGDDLIWPIFQRFSVANGKIKLGIKSSTLSKTGRTSLFFRSARQESFWRAGCAEVLFSKISPRSEHTNKCTRAHLFPSQCLSRCCDPIRRCLRPDLLKRSASLGNSQNPRAHAKKLCCLGWSCSFNYLDQKNTILDGW